MAGEKIPKKFGRYEVTGRVGQGGMGYVLSARDPKLRRDVAIKVVPLHLREAPTVAERFQREALALARLSHPNIVRVFDAGEERGYLYYVMELLLGTGLDQRTLRPEDTTRPAPVFDPKEFLDIFTPLADALAAVHKQGLVHRDIKPANILAGVPERGAVLTDFGLAWVEDKTQLTQTGLIVGTSRYMAPEQVEGAPPDALCDIYGLGVCMFEYATGRLPFEQYKGQELLVARLDLRLPPAAEAAPWLPPALANAIDRCSRFEPAQRYPGARELHRALSRAGRGLDSVTEEDGLPSGQRRPAGAVSGRQVTISSPAMAARQTGPIPVSTEAERRIAMLAMLVVAVVAAAGIVAGLALLEWRDARPAAAAARSPAGADGSAAAASLLATASPAVSGRASAVATAVPNVRVRITDADTPQPVRLGGPGSTYNRVCIAASGRNLLAVWILKSGRVAARLGLDSGARWQTPPLDGSLAMHRTSELELAGNDAGFSLVFTALSPDRSVRAYAASAPSDASRWGPRVELGPASLLEAPVALSAAGGPGRLLACWLGPPGMTPRSAWGDGAARKWLASAPPLGATSRAQRVNCQDTPSGAVFVWQQEDPVAVNDTIYVAHSAGPGRPWTAGRTLFSPYLDESAGPGKKKDWRAKLNSLANALGYERILPATACAGGNFYIQWSERYLVGGRRILLASSRDLGRTLDAVRYVGAWPANSRGSSVTALGEKVWSAWADKVNGTNWWASSPDSARSWTKPRLIGRYRDAQKPPVMAVTATGAVWMAWVDEPGQVHVMNLP